MLAKNIVKNNFDLQKIANQIGNTPILDFSSLISGSSGTKTLSAKAEWQQFGGSVKARPAFNIIKQALREGKLDRDKSILDASSGNTAIAYASIGAKLGIRTSIFLPGNVSAERELILKSLGAEIIKTSPLGGTDVAQDEARTLFHSNPRDYFYADQYGNDNNWKSHYETTAEEIWTQTNGELTHFVCGVGTSGSITGVGRRLKERNRDIRIVGLQPTSPLHIFEGWKHYETAHIPAIYDPFVIDEIIKIESEEALDILRIVARTEGLLLSPSSAANLAGAKRISDLMDGSKVTTLLPDNGEKYLRVLKEWM